MKVKEIQTNVTPIGGMRVGDCFKLGMSFCMKVTSFRSTPTGKVDFVNLKNGELGIISNDTKVILVNLEAVEVE